MGPGIQDALRCGSKLDHKLDHIWDIGDIGIGIGLA